MGQLNIIPDSEKQTVELCSNFQMENKHLVSQILSQVMAQMAAAPQYQFHSRRGRGQLTQAEVFPLVLQNSSFYCLPLARTPEDFSSTYILFHLLLMTHRKI